MFSAIRRQREGQVLPLQQAVFCLDCETISNSPREECPLCRSRSLVNLARMLGGSLFRRERNRFPENRNISFDGTISVQMHDVNARDLNVTIDELTRLFSSGLDSGGMSFRVDVEPTCNLKPL